MSFDLTQSIKSAMRDRDNAKLGAILFGPSGAGKSRAAGTMPGKKLFLYSEGELHGCSSASVTGGEDLLAVRYDESDDGTKLSPDDSYIRLLTILNSTQTFQAAGIKSVIIDGLSELETIVRNTNLFKTGCRTKNGGHDAFQESKVVLDLIRPVLEALRKLQKSHEIHYLVTCALEVTEVGDDGEIMTAKPKLSTYSVVETLVFNFPDQIVVGPMVKDGKKARRFQFDSDLTRVSKDQGGRVKKILNLSPRTTPEIEGLPDNTPADFSKLAAAKTARKWSK